MLRGLPKRSDPGLHPLRAPGRVRRGRHRITGAWCLGFSHRSLPRRRHPCRAFRRTVHTHLWSWDDCAAGGIGRATGDDCGCADPTGRREAARRQDMIRKPACDRLMRPGFASDRVPWRSITQTGCLAGRCGMSRVATGPIRSDARASRVASGLAAPAFPIGSAQRDSGGVPGETSRARHPARDWPVARRVQRGDKCVRFRNPATSTSP